MAQPDTHKLSATEREALRVQITEILAPARAMVTIGQPFAVQCSTQHEGEALGQWEAFFYDIVIYGDQGSLHLREGIDDDRDMGKKIQDKAWYIAYQYWLERDRSFDTQLAQSLFARI